MSIFNTRSSLGLTRYQAAGKPILGNSWFTAVADFIATRFTTETAINVDTITEATDSTGVTIEGVLLKDGGVVSATSPVAGFPVWNGVDPSDWITYMEDFINIPIDDTTGFPTAWTIESDDATSLGAVTDTLGGWMSITSANTNNNETYISTIGESFLFDTDKKFVFKCRLKLTEANTDDANWIIGVINNQGADLLLDNGAGPLASYDGAVFFKVDGTMKIQFETSNAAAQVTNATLADFASATTYNLAFVYDYNDGTTAYVTPYVDGVAGTAHAITIAGLQEMNLVMGVKSGDTNAESLLVDYIAIAQERR